MTDQGQRIDPQDWDQFSKDFHALLDQCLERMKSARDLPWQPKPDDMGPSVALAIDEPGMASADLFQNLTQNIMPYATGNTHPKFFGWVHGTGLPLGVGADLVASTMNSNCGGRDHGAVEIERAVIDWVRLVAGFPDGSSGILTTGTSQGTILALSAARVKCFGTDIRKKGIRSLPDIKVYAAKGAHSCMSKALDVMGHGSDALRSVPTVDHAMDLAALKTMVEEDRAAGCVPLAVVATAGSVNLGTFDPIDEIADYCREQDIWLHIDGAFGFWTRLADEPWRSLSNGVEKADSIACDFHKWMFVPYDCGACLIRDHDLHRATFAERPSYLAPQDAGIGGGDLWYCDYGLELSRGFKALKVWAAIKGYGTKTFGDVITDNCKQATLMGELADQTDGLRLAHPVVSNLCCIALENADAGKVAAQLQLSGDVIFSTTIVDDENCLRAAIVNHRTSEQDIVDVIEAVRHVARS
ncbi:MAG: pyridoxal-dependent decarboxylase [Hyphomicrobiales bacterium]